MADLQVDNRDSIRVLIAEDEAIIAQLIMFTLEEAGISSTVVLSGHDAVEIIAADPTGFQVLVTDIRVGRPPNGWGVAEAARSANRRSSSTGPSTVARPVQAASLSPTSHCGPGSFCRVGVRSHGA